MLRNPPQAINEARITDKQPLHLGQINGAIELEVDLQTSTAECGIRISTGEQWVTIGVNRAAKQVFVDRTASSGFDNIDFLQRHSALLESVDNVHLRVFIDTNAIEVFVNDGEIVFSELLFMDAVNRQLELYASGDETVVQEGCLYALSSIYPTKP